MHKQYVVRLSEEERSVCQGIIKTLKGSSQKVRRAQILLKADADGAGWADSNIAKACTCRVQTSETLRKRLATEGFARALDGQKRQEPPTPGTLECPILANEQDRRVLDIDFSYAYSQKHGRTLYP